MSDPVDCRCGGMPEVDNFGTDKWGIWCKSCMIGWEEGHFDTKEDAVEAWNKVMGER